VGEESRVSLGACERLSKPAQRWRSEKNWHDACCGFSRFLPSSPWWLTKAGWRALSRPPAAEGGGRRAAFTGRATRPYSATEVDGCPPRGRISAIFPRIHSAGNRARRAPSAIAPGARRGCVAIATANNFPCDRLSRSPKGHYWRQSWPRPRGWGARGRSGPCSLEMSGLKIPFFGFRAIYILA
jgi:hypothetical protein